MESDDELGQLALEIKNEEEGAMAMALPAGADALSPRAVSGLRTALARVEALFGIEGGAGADDGPLGGQDVRRITMISKAVEDAVEDDVPGLEVLPPTDGLSIDSWVALLTAWVESVGKNKQFKKWLESEDDMMDSAPVSMKAKPEPKPTDDLDFFAGRMK
jgi:hypothetical protein